MGHYDSGTSGTRVYFSEAETLPIHATASGIATLAFGDGALINHVLSGKLERMTQNTPTDRESLMSLINQAQLNGYVFADQTFERDVCAVAVPFFERSISPNGAIACAFPKSRIDETDITAVAARLWQASRSISRELGGSIPSSIQSFSIKAA